MTIEEQLKQLSEYKSHFMPEKDGLRYILFYENKIFKSRNSNNLTWQTKGFALSQFKNTIRVYLKNPLDADKVVEELLNTGKVIIKQIDFNKL